MIFWVFLIILILLFFALSILKLSFMILISIDGDGFHMSVKVMFYKLLTLYQWDFEEGGLSFLLKKKKDVPDEHKKKKGRLAGIFEILFSKDTFRHLRKKMQIFDVSVKGRLASDDAARTAMIFGGVWAALGTLIPFIPQKRLVLDFYPDFNKESPDFHIACILRVKIIHIIVLIIEFKRNNKKNDEGEGENYGTASY